MKVQFNTFDPAKTMEEKITEVRRAEGEILQLVRKLKAKGITVNSIYVEIKGVASEVVDISVTI